MKRPPSDDDAEESQEVDDGASAGIGVTVTLATSGRRADDAGLSIMLDGEEPQSMTQKTKNDSVWQGVVTTRQAGKRVLTVKGAHYETYTQDLDLQASSSTTIRLADVASGAPKAGIVGLRPYGDFTGEGTMDDADAAKLAKAMAAFLEDDADGDRAVYDMTADGVIDTRDVQLFATTVAAERVKATPETIVSVATSGMTASMPESTMVQGDVTVEDMLKNGETVTLKPSSSGTISAETPVEISIATSVDGTAVELSDMVIAVPADSPNKPTSGEIEIELVNGATQKDLTAFFEAWGMTPDQTTKAYVAQFEPEIRPIQYITDNARAYRIEGASSVASGAQVQAALSHEDNSAQVDIAITADTAAQSGMLGYEVSRNGEVVGFVPADAAGTTVFTDTVATINNRVFTYTVSGVDKTLARADTVTLDPVKISTDGSMDKSAWAATTNMVSGEDATVGDEHDPCEPAPSGAVLKIIDGDYESIYEGALPSDSKEKSQVTLSFNDVLSVTALKYRAAGEHPIKDYEIQVSEDGEQWQTVKTGTFTLDDSGSATVYFSKDGDDWLYTYDAGYLRLIATAQSKVSIAELDVLGATGDDLELISNGIGYLQNDVMLDESTQDKIPAGSLVFTGVYKGNPAYNAIKLYDQDGRLVEGAQVIFAKVPEHGELGETADGRWVYYIEPGQLDGIVLPTSVRAELYRVDDAETLGANVWWRTRCRSYCLNRCRRSISQRNESRNENRQRKR